MLYQQLSEILTTSPGNLTFHLVTAFAIIWALQAAISRWSVRRSPRSQRLVFGFGILFSVRLVLFSFAAFINQESGALSLLPPIDRAVSLFGILMIVWMWAFPEKNRVGDVGLLLLTVLNVGFLAMNLIGWNGHNPEMTFNASLLSPLWEGFSIVLCVSGILFLLIKRTRNWGLGFAILTVNLIGHLTSLLMPILSSNYPAAVRIAQLITYPLLYTLTLDLEPHESRPRTPIQEDTPYYPDIRESGPSFQFPASLFDLSNIADQSEQEIFPALIKSLCGAIQADSGLILSPLDGESQVSVWGIYSPPGMKINVVDKFSIKQLPLIFHAVQRARAIILPAENNAQDLVNLKKAFGLGQNAHTLSVPLLDGAHNTQATAILMRTKSPWVPEDQEAVTRAAAFCYQIATHTSGASESAGRINIPDNLLDEIVFDESDLNPEPTRNNTQQWKNQFIEKAQKVLQINRQLKDLVEKFAKENQRLISSENELQKQRHANHEQKERIALLETEIKTAEARITQAEKIESELHASNEIQQTEIKRLIEEAALIPGLTRREIEIQALLTRIQSQNQELVVALQSAEQEAQKVPGLIQQDKKLRTALAQAETRIKERQQEAEQNQKAIQDLVNRITEMDEVKTALTKANQIIETMQQDVSRTEQKALQAREQIAQLTGQQMTEIAASVQELRYPLSTIVDYSDLVLDESVGPLGALQKKFLERLKEGVSQLENQVDQIIQIIMTDSTKLSLSKQKFDLQPVIDTVNASVQELLREKNISFQILIPPEPITIQTDKSAIEKILLILARNACLVTPPKGKMKLEVSRVDDETKKQFTLFQISDSGEGISAEDIPQVFTSSYQSTQRTIGGAADTEMDLPVAKTLTDAIHGRIWVESAPGKGSRFSVLIPVNIEEGDNIPLG